MLIDGKAIAQEIKNELQKDVTALKAKNTIPHLVVILVGSDPGSLAYVHQKQKVGEEIGVKVSVINFPPSIAKIKLLNLVKQLNDDPSVHGIIIQRPVLVEITTEELDRLVIPQKDIDCFHPDSPFTPPIASAVLKILKWVYKSDKENKDTPGVLRSDSPGVEGFNKKLINWLKKKQILVIGRGETGGKPIADTLRKLGINFEVAHSQTTNLKELCLKADIIISCVGKRSILRPSAGCHNNESYIVRRSMLRSNSILIGVGLHEESGKLKPDYDQEKIADLPVYYTPVPGGVGPVNVACLFENLLKAVVLCNLGSWKR